VEDALSPRPDSGRRLPFGRAATALRCAITDRDGVNAAIAAVEAAPGPIDVLVFAGADAACVTGQLPSVSGGLTMNG